MGHHRHHDNHFYHDYGKHHHQSVNEQAPEPPQDGGPHLFAGRIGSCAQSIQQNLLALRANQIALKHNQFIFAKPFAGDTALLQSRPRAGVAGWWRL
jgi:hypothetical protein